MNLHKCEKIPDGLSYSYGELQSFDEYDIKHLQEHNIDEAWYWYVSDSYEGSGQLLFMKNGCWFLHDCGHCSCYGPLENLKIDVGYTNLVELSEKMTSENLKQVQPLIDMAKKAGYK